MKYTEKIDASVLENKYDIIIGWGGAKTEFENRYNPLMYRLDLMIDSSKAKQGQVVCGCLIQNPNVLQRINNTQKILFVIFPNCEIEIEEEIKKYLSDYDIIISRLIKSKNNAEVGYSQFQQDELILQLLSKLRIEKPFYVDLGVCHPVIRNNTYSIYEKYKNSGGLLIEPNSDMVSLIKLYRPENNVAECGATGKNGEENSLRYYCHPNPSYRGHNTFVKSEAEKQGFSDNYREIPVKNINDIFEEYGISDVDYFDIDTEGMDIEILQSVNFNKFNIKIICMEVSHVNCDNVRNLMWQNGYIHFATKGEDYIFVHNDLIKKL